jgi:hypothetical protein
MWEIFTLIVSIIYMIWLTRLINFGVQTATRIAVATEVSAASVATLVQALSPEEMERVMATRAEAARVEAAQFAQVTTETKRRQQGTWWPTVIGAASLLILLLIVAYATHS